MPYIKLKLIFLFSTLLFSCLINAQPQEELSQCGDKCHIIKPYEEGAYHNEKLLAYKHIMGWELSCSDCHQLSDNEQARQEKLYHSGEFEQPLFRREFSNEFCLECHEDYPGLIERTDYFEDEGYINPHRNHGRLTDCSNCHRVHRRSRFSCSECHKSDWQNILPPGWQIAD